MCSKKIYEILNMHPVLEKIYTLIDEKLLNIGNKKEAIVLSKTIKNLKNLKMYIMLYLMRRKVVLMLLFATNF